MDEFIKNTPGNGKFLYSCFKNYTNQDIIKMLEGLGVKTKVERGNRVFPVTDKSQDVLDAFIRKIKKLNIEIKTNMKVSKIISRDNKVIGVNVGDKFFKADKVILATGGMSYPNTGSTGDGYKLAEEMGHTIIKIKPSLVPLEAEKESLILCKQLQGLSLRNINMKLVDSKNSKIIYEDFGELLFTHFGVSGPTILSSSAHLIRYKQVNELLNNKKIKLIIDLKPALDYEKLDLRIRRDFEIDKNKKFKNSLDKLLPKKLIEPVIDIVNIDPDKCVNEITKKERENLVNLLKNFEIVIRGFRPIEEAIITSGGINTKEINPKTMESKIVNGLYFAGEIIDVDSYTGGFNLQIAYSTGYTSGLN